MSPTDAAKSRIVLVRHGETAWSVSGQHTGHTDIPLTDRGRQVAAALRPRLADFSFAAVLSSPLSRARDTATLAGFGEILQTDADLVEWDYGKYEGLTTSQIQSQRPGWELFRDGVEGGETIAQLGARTDRVLARAEKVQGDVALFAHGHVLRVLAARFLQLPPTDGKLFTLGVASVSVLSHEHGNPVLALWNDQSHLREQGLAA